MATYSVARAKSATLTANTVETVTVTDAYPSGVEIINRSQTGEIWVTFDGTDPTVAGDNCHPVLGARFFENPWATNNAENVAVKLIAASALNYTVESAPSWVRA